MQVADSYLDGYPGRMTDTVSEAKNRLPELIRQAEAGARVTITKRGIPVVEIVSKGEDVPRKRIFGVLGNKKIVIDPDWARPQRPCLYECGASWRTCITKTLSTA